MGNICDTLPETVVGGMYGAAVISSTLFAVSLIFLYDAMREHRICSYWEKVAHVVGDRMCGHALCVDVLLSSNDEKRAYYPAPNATLHLLGGNSYWGGEVYRSVGEANSGFHLSKKPWGHKVEILGFIRPPGTES